MLLVPLAMPAAMQQGYMQQQQQNPSHNPHQISVGNSNGHAMNGISSMNGSIMSLKVTLYLRLYFLNSNGWRKLGIIYMFYCYFVGHAKNFSDIGWALNDTLNIYNSIYIIVFFSEHAIFSDVCSEGFHR